MAEESVAQELVLLDRLQGIRRLLGDGAYGAERKRGNGYEGAGNYTA